MRILMSPLIISRCIERKCFLRISASWEQGSGTCLKPNGGWGTGTSPKLKNQCLAYFSLVVEWRVLKDWHWAVSQFHVLAKVEIV